MDMKKLKKNILEYDLYEVIDDAPHGDYQLTIINEGDTIIIVIEDDKGSATWAKDKEEFLNIGTNEELEKIINSVLYYNYIEKEELNNE